MLSQWILGQGEMDLEAPQGETPDDVFMGGKTPMGSDEGGRSKLGP